MFNTDTILTREEKRLFIDERDAWFEDQDAEHKEDILIAKIRKSLLEEDDDNITYYAGPKGSGKSTAAMRKQMKVYRKWTPWDCIGFTSLEVLKIIQKANKGNAVFWDETGVGWNALRFMSTESVESDKVFTIVREKNLNFDFTGPTFSDMAKSARRLCTLIVALSKNPRGEGKLYHVWVGALDGKVGQTYIGEYHFDKLPDILYDLYKKYRSNYLQYTLDRAIEKLELKAVKEELTKKQFEFWFSIYRGETGLTFSELKSMFPKSTVIYSIQVLKKWGFIRKVNDNGSDVYLAKIPRDLR
jgi:hypothetical protein